MYDIIVCGGGPAGITAAIYAKRYGLQVLVIEKLFIGGQAAITSAIENYPGCAETVSGVEFAASLKTQLDNMEIPVKYAEIQKFELSGKVKKVYTKSEVFEAKAVILAMGTKPRTLGVSGEEKFSGRGVSYCATCDGAFYRGKTAIVVGGGNTAAEDCIFLSRLCKKVYLVHRRSELRAHPYLCEEIEKLENTEILYNAIVTEICGETRVESFKIMQDGNETTLAADGIFVAIGTLPQTELVKDTVKTENGYIITDAKMHTNIEHIYAAGDVTKKSLRQIVTAAADGAVAAQTAAAEI